MEIQLPTFNRLAPSEWFNLADANFHLRGITKRDTKFCYVVSKLNYDTLQKLTAFLAKPRGDDPYAEIRAILCKTYQPKLEQKLDALLAATDLGDKHPAEFTLELRCLLSNAAVDNLLKRIFIRSLPKHLVNAISRNLDNSFDSSVEAAEKAWELSASTCLSVAPVTPANSSSSVLGRQQGSRSQESRAVVL